MSTVVIAACWPLQMPPTAKSVLISLADNANDMGECWPSLDTIAMRTCLHRATVIRAISVLESLGHVVADRSNGRHTRYTLTPRLDLFDTKRPTRNRREPVAERDGSQNATSSTEQPKPVAERNRSQSATGSTAHLTRRTARPDPSHSATQPVAERDTNRQEPSRTVTKSDRHARATQAALAVRAEGVLDAHAARPELLMALEAGVEIDALAATARELRERRGRPANLGYVVATVMGRAQDARAIDAGIAAARVDNSAAARAERAMRAGDARDRALTELRAPGHG